MATPTRLIISPPNLERARFRLVGIAPLMTARFAKKAEIMEKQAEGDKPAKKAKRAKKDFDAEWRDAAYVAPDGWYGINASAIRNACISACRLVGFKMTVAKLSIFVEPDAFDAADNMPIVRITKGEPTGSFMQVRNATGVIDVRARPLWAPGWEIRPLMRWDADQFSLQDVSNLIARVGMQVGLAEGRPDSKQSAGIGYGLFDLVSVEAPD